MIKKVLLVLLLTIVGILIYAWFKPPTFSVSREIYTKASPEIVFPFINSARKSYEWMPWAEGDPTAKVEFSGPEEGLGAMSSWTGDKMGMGISEVTETVLNQSVKTKLTYTKPFSGIHTAEVRLEPNSAGTTIRWSISGENGFIFRLVGIFVDCDAIIGREFEKGLNKLKSLVEPS